MTAFATPSIQFAWDGPGALGVGDNAKFLRWNNTTKRFEMATAGSVSVAFDDLTDVTLTSQAQGDVLFRNASAWVNLAAGTSGRVLKTGGAGANPSWGQVAYSELTGTPTLTHNLLSVTHPDATPGTVARGDVITGQGATPTWTRKALGASGTFLRSDGTDLLYSTIQAADLSARSLADLGTRALANLSDWPSGSALQYLRRNAANDGYEFATISGGVTDHGDLTGLSDDDHSKHPFMDLAKVSQASSPPYNYTPASGWLRNTFMPQGSGGGNYFPYTVDVGSNPAAYYLMVGVTHSEFDDPSVSPPSEGIFRAGDGGWFFKGRDSHYVTYWSQGCYLSLQSWGREIFHSDHNYHTFLDTWGSSLPALRLFNSAATSELLTGYATDGTTKVFALEKTGKLLTNQAVANTNTPSGATVKAMPIYDTAGTLLGYAPLYAAPW